uniref:protein-tyrosine-phosphatase n=1 Tax=Neobodo designis TaxID=312471 RepID=A0A7S1PSR7_NEODS|mmetsp:Transcript_18101/g.56181  ORF Transcript_18101/g.56181 Transcript_18101/m.56181 type:complete len:258 (+) Transcript_18101:62-835(+)
MAQAPSHTPGGEATDAMPTEFHHRLGTVLVASNDTDHVVCSDDEDTGLTPRAWHPPTLAVDAMEDDDDDGDPAADYGRSDFQLQSAEETLTPMLPRSVVAQAIESVAGSPRPPAAGFVAAVDDVLYLGAFRDANNPAECAAQRIGAYLCVAKECSVPAHAVAAGAPALHLPLADDASESLADHIPAAVAFIDAQAAAGRRVALFCQQGRSRSASIAMAYVMQQRGVSGAQALEIVQQRYPRADPNFSFLQQMGCLST